MTSWMPVRGLWNRLKCFRSARLKKATPIKYEWAFIWCEAFRFFSVLSRRVKERASYRQASRQQRWKHGRGEDRGGPHMSFPLSKNRKTRLDYWLHHTLSESNTSMIATNTAPQECRTSLPAVKQTLGNQIWNKSLSDSIEAQQFRWISAKSLDAAQQKKHWRHSTAPVFFFVFFCHLKNQSTCLKRN